MQLHLAHHEEKQFIRLLSASRLIRLFLMLLTFFNFCYPLNRFQYLSWDAGASLCHFGDLPYFLPHVCGNCFVRTSPRLMYITRSTVPVMLETSCDSERPNASVNKGNRCLIQEGGDEVGF